MGRKSTKENKNIYQISREATNMSREVASQLTFISADRIADIENNRPPHPDEVVAMSEAYKDAFLCNYYCAKECAVGCSNVAPQKEKSLSLITVEMLNALHYLDAEKNRFLEIVADEHISLQELDDFARIQERFQKMESVIDSLQLWIKQSELTGKLPDSKDILR